MRLDDRRFLPLMIVASLLFFGARAGFKVLAQQKQQARPECPVTKVSCPDSVSVGEKLVFTADVSGGDSQVTPTFNWSVSAGLIESGQGTSSIEVNTSEVAAESSVTATVELGGFNRECGYGSTAASCTTSTIKKVEARKLDQYGNLQPKDENARLDNLMIELQTDPLAKCYIIAYGGSASRAGDAQKSAEKAKAYLVNKRNLEAQRVVAVDGGYRKEPSVELWIVPSGAEPPQPKPTIEPPANPAKPKRP